MQKYGRTKDEPDYKDHRSIGTNPCAEISLESKELCNLNEIHIRNHDSLEDFLRTLKFAYLFSKTITLMPTHWPETNAVIQRNRRIGTSITGIAEFVDNQGLPLFRKWADAGYDEIQRLDKVYSEWLGVRESIRTTCAKPSGSVSLLSGSTPGVHWPPGGQFYKRAVRFASNDKMLHLFRIAGYQIEEDQYSDDTYVVYFPIKTDMVRSEKDVSIYEKIHLASEVQRYWADNSVSVTVTFDPESERKDIDKVLKMYEGDLKTVSMLPMSNTTYAQMPYTQITEDEYNAYLGQLKKIDFDAIYTGVDNLEAIGEKYCSNDTCAI
jgi:ribonucleotide reductase alpha subunit